jgi:hypothetical protein
VTMNEEELRKFVAAEVLAQQHGRHSDDLAEERELARQERTVRAADGNPTAPMGRPERVTVPWGEKDSRDWGDGADDRLVGNRLRPRAPGPDPQYEPPRPRA